MRARRAHSIALVVLLVCVWALFVPVSGAQALPDDSSGGQTDLASSPYGSSAFSSFTAPTGPPSGPVDPEKSDSTNKMMELVSLSPVLVKVDDEVTVTVKVTNTSQVQIDDPTLSFHLTRFRFSTRTSVQLWDERTLGDTLGTKMGESVRSAPLKPGETTVFSLSVSAQDFGLLNGVDGWGPRGITLTLSGATDGSEATVLDALDTFILWNSAGSSVEPNLDVSAVVPITGPAVNPLNSAASSVRVLEATGKGSRLARVLSSVSTVNWVSYAFDPALIQSVSDYVSAPGETEEPSTQNPATTDDAEQPTDDITDSPVDTASTDDPEQVFEPTLEQVSSQSWLDSFVGSLAGRESFALPAFDADFTPYALTKTKAPRADLGKFPVLEGQAISRDLMWQEPGYLTEHTLAAGASSGYGMAVAQAGTFEVNSFLPYTESATVADATDEPLVVLASDDTLSGLLENPGTHNPVVARQRFVAELAVLSKERPSLMRNIVISASRQWDPDSAVALAQLSVVQELPWLRTSTLAQLSHNSNEVSTDRDLLNQEDTVSLFTANSFGSVRDSLSAVTKFAGIAQDPQALTEPFEQGLAALTSNAWHQDRSDHQATVASFGQAARDLQGSITVATGSDINLISTGSEIPITVQNGLDQDVNVQIRLRPNDSRLQAKSVVPLSIAAGSSQTARVPVSAVGSGNVVVQVEILDEDGKFAANSGEFNVRVRADWENVGTGVVLALLVLLLGGGIWRTVRRGRSQRRAAALDTEEALAVVEAETEDHS